MPVSAGFDELDKGRHLLDWQLFVEKTGVLVEKNIMPLQPVARE